VVLQQASKATFTGRGITSRREITVQVEVEQREPGHGIVFRIPKPDSSDYVQFPATAKYVVNTLRNVTLGHDGVRLCIVEHFLGAAVLFGLDDILVTIDGPEFPLGDGSARFWLESFRSAGWQPKATASTRQLAAPITCRKGDRSLLAVPDESFSVTYLMDWNHKAIGRCWQTWAPSMPIEDIADARTFGSMQEHQLLGIADEVVSLTADGFSQPLRWPDEPVRHKVLDLVGDLALAGVNPLSWKARFISIKGGHEMDVDLAKQLQNLLLPNAE
jgi:UDP-3-O-[3-hydroxymyristoyl] N-acetylglucosamine deacetylase